MQADQTDHQDRHERHDIIQGTGSAKWPDDPQLRAEALAKAKAWADDHPDETGSSSPDTISDSPDSLTGGEK